MATAHAAEPRHESSDAVVAGFPALLRSDGIPTWVERQLAGCVVQEITVAALSLDGSPRLQGVNLEHVRTIFEFAGELPPIVVHRRSWRVIDGAHRVFAARERGMSTISARVYDGPTSDAFLLSVGLNAGHGLPLSRTDRIAAAERITASHQNWSDRMIAVATGLSAGTVAQLRRRAVHDEAGAARTGRDGRIRPLDMAAGRELAGRLITENPGAPLRTIARDAGVSTATAHDVRRRLTAGLPVVPDGARRSGRSTRPRPPGRMPPSEQVDSEATLSLLKDDPALRFNQTGRQLLRWLHRHLHPTTDWDAVVDAVPDHCVGLVASLARSHSLAWSEFAARLERPRSGLDPAATGRR